MFLKALYDYAQERRLLEDLPVERRVVHALIPLDSKGGLRLPHLIPLTQPDAKGKERPGRELLLPRFPGENNGGKAYFLAEGSVAVFGCDKSKGKPIPAPHANKKGKNPTKAFSHFWDQIETAYETTGDARLAALLGFRRRYLLEREGCIHCDVPFLRMRPKDKGTKKGELEYVANTGADDAAYVPVAKATFSFSVDGQPVTLDAEEDPLRRYWFSLFSSLVFAEASDDDESEDDNDLKETLCLVTGRTGEPVARSHKPRIKGVPGITTGGYVVSFARASPAFSSYGFAMGENSPVSQSAAAAYGLALTELLRDEDSHLYLGPVAVCFWAKGSQGTSRRLVQLLSRAHPEQVGSFLRAPFAGDADREVLHPDRLYTVALTGNAGRIVVQHWIDQTVQDAIEHFARWWDDLQIVSLFAENTASSQAKKKPSDPPPSPFAIPNLVRVSLRRSKGQKDDKLVAERVVQLLRAAINGATPSLMMLKPILDEFHTALVKDDAKKPTYPFSQSRFALIKLILRRNPKEGFMPTPRLADTPEPAYNLGRLLAVFESLQDKYHNYEKKGAGIVERYYGTASSAPATVFPLLCRLARNHLSKVRKEDASAANRLDQQIGEVLKKFGPDEPGAAPQFKRILNLSEQGIFALGFYQQRAYDRACSQVLARLSEARKLREKGQSFDEPLANARQLAHEFGYPELITEVDEFSQDCES